MSRKQTVPVRTIFPWTAPLVGQLHRYASVENDQLARFAGATVTYGVKYQDTMRNQSC